MKNSTALHSHVLEQATYEIKRINKDEKEGVGGTGLDWLSFVVGSSLLSVRLCLWPTLLSTGLGY